MATVPGIMYVGGFQATGGSPGLQAEVNPTTFSSDLLKFFDRDVMRVLPDDPDTRASTAASLGFRPWYDARGTDQQHVIAASPAPTTTSCTLGTPTPTWTTNEYVGRFLMVSGPTLGIGFAQRILITGNDTSGGLTFDPTTAPPAGRIAQIGIGRITDYHPVEGYLTATELAGALTSFRGGSTPYSGANGVGPDATMLRRIYENTYPTSPYFTCFKFTTSSGSINGFDDDTGSAKAAFEAELARVVTAATANGDTIDWQLVIIDLMDNDLALGASPYGLGYQSGMEETIAYLRGASVMNKATAGVILVNHDISRWSSIASGVAFGNYVHTLLRADDPYLLICDATQDMPAGNTNETAGAELAANDEWKYYSAPGYLELGRRLADSVHRFVNGTYATTKTGGFPVYLLIGDSIAVGKADSTWTIGLHSISISGPTHGDLTRPSNQLVYNRGSGNLEVYIPHTNSNTSGSTGGLTFAGPDLSIMAELGALHPDGFALIKRASYSSSLAEELAAYDGSYNGGTWLKSVSGEHYDELLADLAGGIDYINNTLDKQADLRGAFVILGSNDAAVSGGGATFAASLGQFCSDLWEDFGTRTGSDKFPIIWRRPQADASTAIAAEVATVRAALVTQAAAESQFKWVNVDDLEVDHLDGIHETPEASVISGRRYVAAMQTISI